MFTHVLVALTLVGWILVTTDQKDFWSIKFNLISKNISCLSRDIYIFFGVGHLQLFISKDYFSLPYSPQLANFYSNFRQFYWVWQLIFSQFTSFVIKRVKLSLEWTVNAVGKTYLSFRYRLTLSTLDWFHMFRHDWVRIL